MAGTQGSCLRITGSEVADKRRASRGRRGRHKAGEEEVVSRVWRRMWADEKRMAYRGGSLCSVRLVDTHALRKAKSSARAVGVEVHPMEDTRW